MESNEFRITPKIKGAAALRLFELGEREVAEHYLIPLYNEGICRAVNKSDLDIVVKILRFTVSACVEDPGLISLFKKTFNSDAISLCLSASDAVINLKLFKILGDCFYLFPSKVAIPSILKTWHKKKFDLITTKTKESDKALETAWGPMLAALGACAASDETYNNFNQDVDTEYNLDPLYKNRNQLEEERKPLIKIFKEIYRLFEEARYQNMGKQDPSFVIWQGQVITISDFENAGKHINKIDKQINNLNQQIDKLESSLSAGNILMKIAGNTQRYHPYLRQYAAIGLLSLAESSYLDNQTKEKIAVYLESLFQSTKDEKRFRTFEIRLSSDTSPGEFLNLIHTGIRFLTRQSVGIEYDQLPIILNRLKAEIPNLFDFFSKYPLRLVLPEDKCRFYGIYSSSRYDLERWTRYHGELYIGEVEDRFYEIDDLTQPNSMGISIFALQHLFIALPTLWHEYQHYGERGIKAGNENEMAVYLLENIFLRQMILDHLKQVMPSESEVELHKILHNLRYNDSGAYFLLTFDLFDIKSYSYLKNIIEINYPERQLSREEALIKAKTEIKKQDDLTIEANLANFFWHPEIKWPLLIGSNSDIYNKLNSILIKTLTKKNILSLQEWKELLLTPEIVNILNEWKLFYQKYKLDTFFNLNPGIVFEENTIQWINRI